MELSRFMLECASICPETSQQKLESQRIYLTLLTMALYMYVQFWEKNVWGCGFNYTVQATALIFIHVYYATLMHTITTCIL